MRILKIKPLQLLAFFLTFYSAECIAQDGGISISQDPRFEQLLAEKRKINSSITVNDRYKIQIFNGDMEKSKKTLSEFKRDFKNLDSTIIFESPAYKVWIGNFKSRIEAERYMVEIKKKYPYALLIKPNR